MCVDKQEKLFIDGEHYFPPYGYTYEYTLISTPTHSIPAVRLTLIDADPKSTLIYSHGNASDLASSLKFVSSLTEFHKVNYLVYDYTGYGSSKLKETTAESIGYDLEMVLAWNARPLEEITLVGFSLGCFPTAKVAAKHRVKAVVLLAPLASLISLFEEELTPYTFFKEDQFNLLEIIENIESHLLIAHSRHDELIPYRHAEVIFERYVQISKNPSAELVELKKLKHNEMHIYLTTPQQNSLKTRFFHFLERTREKASAAHYICHRKQHETQVEGKMDRDLKQLLKHQTKQREKDHNTVSENQLRKLRSLIRKPNQ